MPAWFLKLDEFTCMRKSLSLTFAGKDLSTLSAKLAYIVFEKNLFGSSIEKYRNLKFDYMYLTFVYKTVVLKTESPSLGAHNLYKSYVRWSTYTILTIPGSVCSILYSCYFRSTLVQLFTAV